MRGITLHQTVRSKKWWIEQFAKNGLCHLPKFEGYFNTQYIRGPKQNAEGSFHLILSSSTGKAPAIPKEPITVRLLDRWHMSKTQKLLEKILDMKE